MRPVDEIACFLLFGSLLTTAIAVAAMVDEATGGYTRPFGIVLTSFFAAVFWTAFAVWQCSFRRPR